jgi:hypothetical protein
MPGKRWQEKMANKGYEDHLRRVCITSAFKASCYLYSATQMADMKSMVDSKPATRTKVISKKKTIDRVSFIEEITSLLIATN